MENIETQKPEETKELLMDIVMEFFEINTRPGKDIEDIWLEFKDPLQTKDTNRDRPGYITKRAHAVLSVENREHANVDLRKVLIRELGKSICYSLLTETTILWDLQGSFIKRLKFLFKL